MRWDGDNGVTSDPIFAITLRISPRLGSHPLTRKQSPVPHHDDNCSLKANTVLARLQACVSISRRFSDRRIASTYLLTTQLSKKDGTALLAPVLKVVGLCLSMLSRNSAIACPRCNAGVWWNTAPLCPISCPSTSLRADKSL